MNQSVIHGQKEGIIVCDYGSQYTLLIARRLRELGFYAEIVDGAKNFPPKDFLVKGVILSGGPDSVGDSQARSIPDWVIGANVPILGICYGMQLVVSYFGGKVTPAYSREYGRSIIQWHRLDNPYAIQFLDDLNNQQSVWMSHGDTVSDLGTSFQLLGHSEDEAIASVVHKELPIIGIQFHLEVHHTENGAKLLKNFAAKLCKMHENWQSQSMLEVCIADIKEKVGENGHLLLAVSGGVDSTVASVVLAKAVGNQRVTCVMVDHGLMRLNEVSEVESFFRKLNINLEVLSKSELFLSRLKGVSDPEQKRKIIGNTFIECFENYAKAHENEFTHLGQGTLYPDVIESAGHGSGAKIIKSHHNVGGLPEKLHLSLVEPFRFLFKDEVRQIGRSLGIPEAILMRHPFPGPGLAVRIPGEVAQDKIEILQKADDLFIRSLKREGYYHKIWQAATILLPVKSVGVMGDNRTYQWTCVLRAVTAADGMTADVADLPASVLSRIADEIVRKVEGINRVLYDVTSKPPATIEWE